MNSDQYKMMNNYIESIFRYLYTFLNHQQQKNVYHSLPNPGMFILGQPLPWLISSWCSYQTKVVAAVAPFFQNCANTIKHPQRKKAVYLEHLWICLSFAISSTYTYIYIIHIQTHCKVAAIQTSKTTDICKKKDLKRRCNILTRSLASRFRRLQLVIEQHDFYLVYRRVGMNLEGANFCEDHHGESWRCNCPWSSCYIQYSGILRYLELRLCHRCRIISEWETSWLTFLSW